MKLKITITLISLLTGMFFGWLVFHPSQKTEEKPDNSAEVAEGPIWTCAMHPQIRMEQPGKCPICGMELVPPVRASRSSDDVSEIHLSKEAAHLANVLTNVVAKQTPVKEVRLYGKVKADERLFQSQVAHVPGRIERLSVNFTGESVVKGQVLAEIFSPELITAQQELLETAETKQLQPELYEASKEKLRHLKLTDDQIAKIESSGIVRNNFEVVSNTNGTVTALRVSTGDYISSGTVLFEIADLSKLWIMFDAYESDLQFLHKGEEISFNIRAYPGTDFKGEIVFIDPVIDPLTRVAKIRVETGNQTGKLKPEMFATGVVHTTLSEYSGNVVIPKTSVLWTGKRSVVYVKKTGTDEPIFKLREIGLGPLVGESYVITDGLTEGEEIVTSGTFSVDAAAQLEGKPSMMTVIQESGIRTKHASFNVSGKCDMCRERIESAAVSITGTTAANWNSDTGILSVDFNPEITDMITIQKAIAKVGHDTELFKADDVTYKALPECCHYRNYN